jgi:hypothetical protein
MELVDLGVGNYLISFAEVMCVAACEQIKLAAMLVHQNYNSVSLAGPLSFCLDFTDVILFEFC